MVMAWRQNPDGVARPCSPRASKSDPRQIRLVKLFPGKFEDTIRCELEHVSLSSNPTFAALSYTWGDPRVTSPILLNGQDYHVTRNLESFLRHMQSILNEIKNAWPRNSPPAHRATLYQLMEAFSQSVEDDIGTSAKSSILTNILRDIQDGAIKSRFLTQGTVETAHQNLDDENSPDCRIPDSNQMHFSIWIDALSINQQDIAERNNQVALMGDIYKSTCLVYIWAGSKDTEPGVKGSDAFRLVDEVVDRGKQAHCSASDKSPSDYMLEHVSTLGFLRSNTDAIQNLSRFLRIPWFSRAWILQEVTLSFSRCRTTLWFGFGHINFSFFVLISPLCCNLLWSVMPYSLTNIIHSMQYGERILRTRELYSTFLRDNEGNKRPSKVEIATRLLRLLTVACPGAKLTDPRDMIYSLLGMLATKYIPSELQPNYALSASSVYHRTAAFLLMALGSEALGFFLSSREGMEGVPSWVPNFAKMPPIADTNTTNDRQDVAVFSDSTGLELRIAIVQCVVSVVIPIIPVAAYCFKYDEEVSVLVPTLGKGLITFEQQVLSQLETRAGLSPQHCASTWSAFWKGKMGFEDWDIVENFIQASRAENLTFDFNQKITDSKFVGLLAVLEKMSESGLAVTQGGHLVYSGRPTRLEVGDKVCTVRGVSKPCILRQRGEKYIFIGICMDSSLPANGTQESHRMQEELVGII